MKKDFIGEKDKNKNIVKAVLLPCLFWLAVWQLLAVYVGKDVLLPAPKTVLKVLIFHMGQKHYWYTIAMSLFRITLGFILAVIIALPAAVVMAKFKRAEYALSPIIKIIRATPVASFILFLLIWCKNEYVPSIITFLMVCPIVTTAVYRGIKSRDKRFDEVAYVFGLTQMEKIKKVTAPQVKPYFVQSLITSLGLAWKSGIAAEVLTTPENSLGKMIYNAKIYLETPEMFARTLTVIILSMILENIMVALLNKSNIKNSYPGDKSKI
jgi:NitT/TauT family transport system permease protein